MLGCADGEPLFHQGLAAGDVSCLPVMSVTGQLGEGTGREELASRGCSGYQSINNPGMQVSSSLLALHFHSSAFPQGLIWPVCTGHAA